MTCKARSAPRRTAARGNASLADGYLEDGTIGCPLHQGVFDIRSGKPKCPPVTTDLRRYEVKVDGDVIYLKAEAA